MLLEADGVARLRDALVDADYTVDGVLATLGPLAYAALSREESVPALRVTVGGSRLETLVRLFLLQHPVDAAAAARALPVEACLAGGLVERDGTDVRARVDLRPYAADDDDFYVVSDLGAGLGGARRTLHAEHVLGLSGASTTLAGLTVREPFATALDLGTGCGVQALHLSRHVDRVTGTDRSPRALSFAALSTALSEVSIELVEGSLFEPVAGRRFDLVVSNPPFVVSPMVGGRRFTYRDSGLPGDEVCRRLVGQASAHLSEGGWCQLLANWLHVDGQDWRERVASWVLPTGCDAWVVQRDVQDPAEYAELWLRDSGDQLSADYRDLYDAWLGAFASDAVVGIGFGWIVLHAAGHDQPYARLDELTWPVEQPLGLAVLDWFARHDWLRAHGDDQLLAATLVTDPGLVLRQDSRLGSGPTGGWQPSDQVVLLTEGLRGSGAIDAVGAAVLGSCDGSRPLALVLDQVAGAYEMSPDDLRHGAVGAIRSLIEEGFLRPSV
ncbi:MAG: class I SAM-dependent methyltransferase [Candidatus Nanopelagicales bacterium]